MAIPIWTSSAGVIAEIDEGVAYSNTLTAVDSDDDILTFSVVAGSLPDGLVLSTAGVISGTPDEVSKRTEKKFVVRVTDGSSSVDRTFTLFVNGADAPVWGTDAGSLGIVQDGLYVDKQLVATDADDNIKFYKVIEGSLPPALELNEETGRLTGVIDPIELASYDSTNTGFDAVAWDTTQPWDLIVRSGSVDRLWEFTVRVSDGVAHSDRVFSLDVRGRSIHKADTTKVLADANGITADVSDARGLYFVQDSGSLATLTHSNYHIVKIDIKDPDDALGLSGGNTITYSVLDQNLDSTTSSLPPGMSLDYATGELYGNVPYILDAETTYNFSLRAEKTNPLFGLQFVERQFAITIRGANYGAISWNTVDRELII